MRKVLIICLLCVCGVSAVLSQSVEVLPLVEFLKKQDKSAKEYILDQFRDKDIVIFCERHHGEMTQYDLIWGYNNRPVFHR